RSPGWRNWRYAADLKSVAPNAGREGSTPSPGISRLRARRQRVERVPLGALAAVRVAERREGLFVEGRADGNVPLAQTRGRRRPPGDRDLAAESRERRAHHPVRARVVKGTERVDG